MRRREAPSKDKVRVFGLAHVDVRTANGKDPNHARNGASGVVTLPWASVKRRRLRNCQAAATAVRHVVIAAARSVRCVWAEMRWRWTLKVL